VSLLTILREFALNVVIIIHDVLTVLPFCIMRYEGLEGGERNRVIIGRTMPQAVEKVTAKLSRPPVN
jgi:hypothetical protein